MAGTLQRAGVRIVRRATALGLGGLAAALFVGVMAFAFTTTPAGRAEEGAASFISSNVKQSTLRTLSAMRPTILEATPLSVVPVNEQALEASRVDVEDGDEAAGEALAGSQAATDAGAEVEPSATPEDGRVVAAALTAPAGTTPALVAGDRIEATISFYYCERGERGLHPGDGGKFCGVMRDGSVVYPGAAACAYVYLGQRFRIEGDPTERVYTCADTGSAVHGLHRDIWFMSSDDGWSWQRVVGQRAVIEILE